MSDDRHELDAGIAHLREDLSRLRGHNAELRSEVTWWRERMREEWEALRTRAAETAARAGQQEIGRHGRHRQAQLAGEAIAFAIAADRLARIVAEAEDDRNETATPGGHDGPTWRPRQGWQGSS